MSLKKNTLIALLFLSTAFSLVKAQQNLTSIDGHPNWMIRGNIYEVNVRQYTQEGTFKAFAKSLPRLKKMGVQTLWFMPINPIGVLDRKGVLGSYYAVSNYKAINPEFGNLNDWKQLVKQCHAMGFKVIIDWVANHTAADHYWLQTKPNFYVQDSITHKAISPFDWTDARKLNYKNNELCDSMVSSMAFWLQQSNIDGFRCDVASEVPKEFWKKCITKLRKGRNIFMLAEASVPWIHEAGFDATYTWPNFNVMKDIVKGTKNANDLEQSLKEIDSTFPKNALRMFFTSNHDENSWSKADYGTTPGETHAPFAVFTQTVKRSVPLIYSGQEEPVLDSISFFYKDPIHFKNFKREAFYTTLLALRKRNIALDANASMNRVATTDNEKVYAYLREKEGKKVLVILNLSKNNVSTTVTNVGLNGSVTEIFSNKIANLKTTYTLKLNPWDYKVYEYK